MSLQGMNNGLIPADQGLIDHIVGEVKSQGIFDQFRKECLADVDTKPAYQNLRTRVESSVNSFLNKQVWKNDLNKNQLRDTLRKHIHEAPYLEVGVERIVDQVVNPKVYSNFMPQIEDVVYKFMGIERPKSQRNGSCDMKDLLPKDLDPISPESDRNSEKELSMEIDNCNTKATINGDDKTSIINNNNNETEEKVEVDSKPILDDKIKIEIVENGESQLINSPTKVLLNTSLKSNETIKTEEEEEESPSFEPIEAIHAGESNMSNESPLSGISELTSQRSQTPDFSNDYAQDNFDCSNQDSQLSKVSSTSRLSIVTDVGSSNQASTPFESKDDSKNTKDNFKNVKEFNFEVTKDKESSQIGYLSQESSRDFNDKSFKLSKEDCKSKSPGDKHQSRNSRSKHKRRHSSKSKRPHRSKSKDCNDSDKSELRDTSKLKSLEKKGEISNETKDLKDIYKEKIRELREKKELTEKEKLNKVIVDKKETGSKEKEDLKKNDRISHMPSNYKKSSHSDSREIKNNLRREERIKNDTKSSKNKRDSKYENKSSLYKSSKDKKRKDEKRPKSTDDHSSLRQKSNERRSTDKDPAISSSSKHFQKDAYESKVNTSLKISSKNSEESSNNMNDSLQEQVRSYTNPPRRVDPGSSEICLPLKKRPLHNNSMIISPIKKIKLDEKRVIHKKKDIFKIDMDVEYVPDDERVQIIEYEDEDYDGSYPEPEPILSLEETKKIILDAEPSVQPSVPKLSEMEQSIQESLREMMADHKMFEEPKAAVTTPAAVMDSESLLETLTDDSINESGCLLDSTTIAVSTSNRESIEENIEDIQFDVAEAERSIKEDKEKLEASLGKLMGLEDEEMQDQTVGDENDPDNIGIKLEDNININNELEIGSNSKNMQILEKANDSSHQNVGAIEESAQNPVPELTLTSNQNNECLQSIRDFENKDDSNTQSEDNKNIENPCTEQNDNVEKSVIEKNHHLLESDENTCSSDEVHSEDKLIIDEEFDSKPSEEDSKIQDNIKKINCADNDKILVKNEKSAEEVKEEVKEIIEDIQDKNMFDGILSNDKKNSKSEDSENVAFKMNADSDRLTEMKFQDFASKDNTINNYKSNDFIKIVGEKSSEKLINESEDSSNDPKEIHGNEEKIIDNQLFENKPTELKIDDSNENLEQLDIKNPTSIKENLLELIKEECSPKYVELEAKKDFNKGECIAIDSKETGSINIESALINRQLISPVEEDCYYLECDPTKYNKFKQFLSNYINELEKPLPSAIPPMVAPVIAPVIAPEPIILPFKRKSPSIESDITSEIRKDNVSSETETPAMKKAKVIKKRKVGRQKKAVITLVTSSSNSQEVQEPSGSFQQQTSAIEGEDFLVPLSPRSDISAASDKGPSNLLKEDRSRNRSSQRYSSDDLYKPRPMITTSSRRQRRYQQA